MNQSDTKMPDPALSGQQVGNGDLQQSVIEQVKKKIDKDNDVEKCNNSVIIYKVGEMDADSAADRNESDLHTLPNSLTLSSKLNQS